MASIPSSTEKIFNYGIATNYLRIAASEYFLSPPPALGVKASPLDFINLFLSRPASYIPKGAQWAVVFDSLEKKILPAISIAYNREPGGRDRWVTERAAQTILNNSYQQMFGCLFCQAIGLPGESSNPVAEGNIKSNGLLRSYVGAGRNDFPIMRMSFIDTNISFADSFLRGWSLATSHLGMIARSGEENYRTNMTCYKFGVTPVGPVILMQMTFEGLCCISVSEEEYNYDTPSSWVRREAQFVYHNYSVDTISGNSSSILGNRTLV